VVHVMTQVSNRYANVKWLIEWGYPVLTVKPGDFYTALDLSRCENFRSRTATIEGSRRDYRVIVREATA
jgi:hypothetical protein